MPNITLTSLPLELGLDLAYETSELPQLAELLQSKISPVSSEYSAAGERRWQVLADLLHYRHGNRRENQKVLEESFWRG